MWEIPSLIILLLLLHISVATSQPICGVSGETFANNSTYEANLNTLIASLSSGGTSVGRRFLNTSVGHSPDTVNAFVACRGNISLPACRKCVAAAAPTTAQRCPNWKEAIFWNETCMFKYSDKPIFGGVLNIQPVPHLPSKRILLQNTGNGTTYEPPPPEGTTDEPPPPEGTTYEPPPPEGTTDEPPPPEGTTYEPPPPEGTTYEPPPPEGTTNGTGDGYYTGFDLPPEEGKASNKTAIIVGVAVSVCVFFGVFVAVLFIRRRKAKKKAEENFEKPDEVSTDDCQQYDLAKIRAATDDFSDDNKLGEGGFGAVYKGIFSNGEEIAVKRLAMGSTQGHTEFKNEVLLMARLQHRNLVRLLGFCDKGNERILVYEFLENSSLDKFLFDRKKRSQLDWDRRFKIIQGIARGTVYLHEDSRLKIIHRDLKPSNILLDRDMNPKVADFGMARLFKQDETQENTSRIVGTYGYMSSPEYIRGEISIKTDVYSFGVLVLEIMSGRKHYATHNGQTEDLLTYIWEKWEQGTTKDSIDPILGDGLQEMMLRCIHIGLLGVQEDPRMRPTMAEVVTMLSSSTVTLPVPSRPAFLSTYSASYVSCTMTSDSVVESSSRNDITLAALSAR